MSPKKQYYETLAETLIEKFAHRGIEAYYVDNSEDALAMARRYLTPECSVSWGGSETLNEIGLIAAIKASDCVSYDRLSAKTPEEKKEIYGKIFTCDYYFMSTNAITLDGELVNVDGNGNRVACLIYGPENVIIVAGMNKVTADVESAHARVRNIAAPPNTIRLNRKTPCAHTGKCENCLSPDCICSNIVITRRSFIPNRIKVILVGEELGF